MNKKIKYIILSLLIISFFLLLWSVLAHKIDAFDTAVYNLVTIKKNDTVTSIYKFITFFGSTKLMVALAIFCLVIFHKNKKGAFVTVGLIISTIVNNIIKPIVRRQRPLKLMMVEESTFSFPSGHTMASVTMYGLFIYLVWQSNLNKKLKVLFTILLTLLIIAIGLSRIYLGAHYASDVIASVIVSTVWLIIYISFVKNKKFI